MATPPAPPRKSPADTAVLVTTRRDFYRDGYRRMQQITLVACIAAVVGLGVGICGLLVRPAPLYFPTGPGCTLRALSPVAEPTVTDDEVLSFATRAAVRTYSFDHVNWRQEFIDTARLFTKAGWDGILTEMKKTGNLDRVVDRRLVASAVAQTAPAIVDQFVENGTYTWVVAFDMLTLYRGVDGDFQQKVRAEVRVVRVPENTVSDGAAIKVNSLKIVGTV